MAPKDGQLSHEEIWDDSALVGSWNQALDEYKKYHSIHAKGGSLADLEAEELNATESLRDAQNNEVQILTGRHADDKQKEATFVTDTDLPETVPTVPEGSDAQAGAPEAVPNAPPQALLGTMQDEGLKRLLMSWYYAGYYTGLFEGQQQQQQQQQQKQQ